MQSPNAPLLIALDGRLVFAVAKVGEAFGAEIPRCGPLTGKTAHLRNARDDRWRIRLRRER